MSVPGQTALVVPADLLVVACDPRNLNGVCDYSADEAAVFSRLQNYTFHTTVVKVPVPTDPSKLPKFGVILKPEAIDTMLGDVSGFRNETAKQFSLETANQMSENLVTVYQLLGPEKVPMTQAQFLKRLNDTLLTLDWWPYESYQICTDDNGDPITLTTPYFDHFDNVALGDHLPWKYLAVQGTKNTLYVHGSTCFESVLQCWQYGGMLLDQLPTLGISLPPKTGRIAVLGAGPSGLMFAHRLQGLGFTNVHIYEATDRIGGKTHSVKFDQPKPPVAPPVGLPHKTACELGTCYLSPAYDDMANELSAFMSGNVRQGFYLTANHKDPQNHSFRGMVTEDQFNGVPVTEAVMDYDDYYLLRGYYEANQPFADPPRWKDGFSKFVVDAEIVTALLKYEMLVDRYMGFDALPMPLKPTDLLIKAGYASYYDFLKRNDLLILCGVLEYAYSVQGYGPLNKIPAYYGMIWISMELIWDLFEAEVGLKKEAGVTVLLSGWLDVWLRMSATLNITKNAKVIKIERS
jgi:NAD(P)-binding Rossmann-like domain